MNGNQLLTIGTLDTILVHPREVFRGAVIAAAAVIVIMHNLCGASVHVRSPIGRVQDYCAVTLAVTLVAVPKAFVTTAK